MSEIIWRKEDFDKKKKYICNMCNKLYKLNELAYAQKEGKCPKCGGELKRIDFTIH